MITNGNKSSRNSKLNKLSAAKMPSYSLKNSHSYRVKNLKTTPKAILLIPGRKDLILLH